MVVGTLQTFAPPAVHDGRVFVLNSGVLQSFDSFGQTMAWSYGDGTLVTPPIVVSGRIFVGSSDGTLYGIDESTGSAVWSDEVGTPFGLIDDEGGGNAKPAALAAAGGLLVAPAGTSLVVYGVSGDGGVSDSGATDAGSAVDAADAN